MSNLSHFSSDKRFVRALERLNAGEIELLVLDVFACLLGRLVPAPRDVFLRLGVLLQEEGLLGPGLAPDSFAALRYQTEQEASKRHQCVHGTREVTLVGIYALMPAQTSSLQPEELMRREIEVEHELCFADPEAIILARHARERGLKIALIAESSFSERALRELVEAKAPDLPKPDAVFVSNDRDGNGPGGLLEKAQKHFDLPASACLFVHSKENDSDRLLVQEQPIQWHARTSRYAQPGGDFGLTWLRRKAAFWMPDVPQEAEAYYTYGATMMGPLLAGFAAWAAQRAAQEKAACLFGLLREGEHLIGLLDDLKSSVPAKPMAISRLAVALASFAPECPEHLEDFLTRRGYWTLGMLMAQLGFSENDAAQIGDPAETPETIPPVELTSRLLNSSLAAALHERSAARREKLMRYLKKIGALDSNKLYLLDLGYAATIQRGLQRVFKIEGKSITTHGLYLAAAHVSRATQWEGGIVEGFLAQNGNPNDFARAFCRSPEIVELSCMPSYGTLEAYTDNGEPVFGEDTTSARQKKEVAWVQRGTRDFAQRWRALWDELPVSPDFCSNAWRGQMRDVATRLVVYPSAAEAKLMGHWEADSDMGLTSPRPIVSAGPYAGRIARMNGKELAALPRRDVPWLFGVAASLSHVQARQTAAIMLRTETEF